MNTTQRAEQLRYVRLQVGAVTFALAIQLIIQAIRAEAWWAVTFYLAVTAFWAVFGIYLIVTLSHIEHAVAPAARFAGPIFDQLADPCATRIDVRITPSAIDEYTAQMDTWVRNS